MYALFNMASLYEHLYNSFYESSNFNSNVIGMQYDPKLTFDFVPTTIGEFYLADWLFYNIGLKNSWQTINNVL